MIKNIIFVVLFSLLFFTAPSFAAQSTADVSASVELKQSARTEVLGAQGETIHSQDEYIIGHGDVLSVSIYGEGDMAASTVSAAEGTGRTADSPRVGGNGVTVMMDGRISLKHIGDIEVVGLTLTQLADYLKKLYSTIFDDPIITTTLQRSNSLRYTMMGNVTQPGILFLDYPLTLVQAVARSGGFTEWANKELTVVRETLKSEDESQFKGNTLDFDYDDFVSGKGLTKNIFIRSGDIIIVH